VDDREAGWPCQRFRLGIGAVLFFLFEVTIPRQLPMWLAYAILFVGVACLVSAFHATRGYKRKLQVDLIREALASRSP
jgi:hypothetical protein